MDLETIKRINRDALRAAKQAAGEAESEVSEFFGSSQTTMYIVALAVAVGVFFFMRYMQFDFVMKDGPAPGNRVFDNVKGGLISVLVGLGVLVAYSMMNNQ